MIEFKMAIDGKPFAKIQKQLSYAIVVALTRTANQAKTAVRAEMVRVFDRPTPYTLNSLMVTPATKGKLSAELGFKMFGGTPPLKFLGPEIFGGARNIKRFERAIGARAGFVSALAPAAGAKIDKYGNVSTGQIGQILSQLRARSDPQMNETAQSRGKKGAGAARYFALGSAHGGLKPGVYMRKGRKIIPVFHVIAAPSYRPRLKFYDVAIGRMVEAFPQEFARAFDGAMASAK